MKLRHFAIACAALLPALIAHEARAVRIVPGSRVRIQDLVLSVPSGWKLTQESNAAGGLFMTFSNADTFVSLYVKSATGLSTQQLFVNGAQVRNAEHAVAQGNLTWRAIDTSKESSRDGQRVQNFVSGFLTEYSGKSYFGYARAANATSATTAAQQFMTALRTGGSP